MNKRILAILLAMLLVLCAGCGKKAAAPEVTEAPKATETAEDPEAVGTVEPEVVEIDFVPVAVDAKNFDAFKAALAGDDADEITLDKNIDITENLALDRTLIIPEGITVTVKAGTGFYVENGLIENNGTLRVEGMTDSAAAAMLAITGGGGFLNNGSLIFAASALNPGNETPLGGQLRLNGGTLENNGTVTFEGGENPYMGGAGEIAEDGAFVNMGKVELLGGFLTVSGRYVNEVDSVLTANAPVYLAGEAEFDNMGALEGSGTVNGTPAAQYEN